MYDVLVYLFENCQQTEVAYDSDRVAKKLSAAGFEDADISEALHWLSGVRAARAAPPPILLSAPRAAGGRKSRRHYIQAPALAQESRSVTVRLKTGRPATLSFMSAMK